MSQQQPKRKCKSCGHSVFKRSIDSAANDLSCENCGMVIEENPIVSELQFGEGSNGAAFVNGSFIKADQSSASNSLKSREITLLNAKKNINSLAAALHIAAHVAEAASKWFNLALNNNFVKGRKSQNVIAACLYIACRREKTPHMLIDFSSRLQTSVYSIGSTFLKLVKQLEVSSLPLADPSLFIDHFAEQLNFGPMKSKVVKDAVKLAQRMSSDWIHEGRRPAGIAGACVLLAARMNNFRRTHQEIIALAHIGEETLQKRLTEFKNTNAAKMSISQFRNTQDSEIKSTLPPSFSRARKNSVFKPDKSLSSDKADLIRQVISDGISLGEINMAISRLSQISKDVKMKGKKTGKSKGDKKAAQDIVEGGKDNQRDKDKHVSGSDEDSDDEEILEGDAEQFEANNGFLDEEKRKLEEIEKNRPRNLSQNLPKTSELLGKVADGDDFDDIDDSELDSLLLNTSEVEAKEQIFVNLNGDYLLEMEEKRLKKEADEANGITKPVRKRRKVNRTGLDSVNADALAGAIKDIGEDSKDLSAGASVKNMLRAKSHSAKLNYSAIDGLFNNS